MLHEIVVAQKEKGIFRRWFQNDYFDIIVWYNLNTKLIHGFQLCYNISQDEHSLTWMADQGFTHSKIDDGKRPFRHPSAPLLIEDGLFPAEIILNKFIDSCIDIDKNISRLIINKIIEFGKLMVNPEDIEKLIST